jgi:hypothetical protein
MLNGASPMKPNQGSSAGKQKNKTQINLNTIISILSTLKNETF